MKREIVIHTLYERSAVLCAQKVEFFDDKKKTLGCQVTTDYCKMCKNREFTHGNFIQQNLSTFEYSNASCYSSKHMTADLAFQHPKIYK